MAVYIDAPKWQLGRMLMCHMVADSIEELHKMADAIGVSRRHFQNQRLPHYDICKSKRALAITRGAIEASSKTIVLKSKALLKH